jgi:hypothetical protein
MSARSSLSSEEVPESRFLLPDTIGPASRPSGGADLPFLFPRRDIGATTLLVVHCSRPSSDVCSQRRPKRADLVS